MDAKDELANNRLEELKKLQELYQNLHIEHDKLKQQVWNPSNIVFSIDNDTVEHSWIWNCI